MIMMSDNVVVLLSGGDFDGATVSVPGDVVDFYVYSGDMINVYHVDGEKAVFLLDELATNFTIPDNAWSVELIWNV